MKIPGTLIERGARSRRILAGAGLAIAVAASMSVEAQPPAYTKEMMAMLPGYCKYTQDFRSKVPGANDPAEIERWYGIMGPDFHHMHHYCWGLISHNNALSAKTKGKRISLLAHSTHEWSYVVRNVGPTFIMLPEILTKRGENFIRIGDASKGAQDLERATELKPDYWPPYAALSDFFKSAGDITNARSWLERGLAAAPDAKALKRRLAELGPEKGGKVAPPPE